MSKKDLLFLNYNDECDTSAKDAYTRYAKRYNWDLSKASNFAPRKLLYARAVTPEGYSPWFVAHSNFISADDSNGKWLNRFENDLLFEEWLPDSSHLKRELTADNTRRIVFAKKSSGKYYFMGVYEPINIKRNAEGNFVKTYKRVSLVYPF